MKLKTLNNSNKAIKFAPYGRRTLSSSRRLWRRYVSVNYDLCPKEGWKEFSINKEVCKFIFAALMPIVNSKNLQYLNFTSDTSIFEDMFGNMLQMQFDQHDEDLIISMNVQVNSEDTFKNGYLERVISEIESLYKIMRV